MRVVNYAVEIDAPDYPSGDRTYHGVFRSHRAAQQYADKVNKVIARDWDEDDLHEAPHAMPVPIIRESARDAVSHHLV